MGETTEIPEKERETLNNLLQTSEHINQKL